MHPAVIAPHVVRGCALKTNRGRNRHSGGRRGKTEQGRGADERGASHSGLALEGRGRCRGEGIFTLVSDVVLAGSARTGIGVDEGTELTTGFVAVGEVGREGGERRSAGGVHFEDEKIA